MSLLQRRRKPQPEGTGLVLFQEVQQAMRAEKVLKAAGHVREAGGAPAGAAQGL